MATLITSCIASLSLLALASLSHAQLRPSQDKAPSALPSHVLDRLSFSASSPVHDFPRTGSPATDAQPFALRQPTITLGLRLSNPSFDTGSASSLHFSASLGKPSGLDCATYALYTCRDQPRSISSTLSELARINSLSISYRLSY